MKTLRCPKCRSTTIAVRQRRCNHSAFNGYRFTPSRYSELVCGVCGWPWRTLSKQVDSLPDVR